MPFDDNTLVFKVMGKMFALSDIDSRPNMVNVKCDPEKAIELRERYTGVEPGYHMSKVHWNTIRFDGSISDEQARQWIQDSYDLVVSSLTRKLKAELEEL